MIEKMHDKTNSPLFKIIFALVSLSFVLGGIGGGLMLQDHSAVKVNGEEISQQQFIQAKNREQNLRNAQEGEKFWDKLDDPAYVQAFNNDVFNQLINDELLRQYASDLKLNISAEQVKSQIVHTPAFQQNGKFDNALYLQTLRNNGISAEHYAAIVAQGMLMSQLQEGIITSNFSVPAQQELLAKLLLQKRHIRIATYPIANEIAKQSATDEEIQAFYQKHQNSFKTPEKFTVEYIEFSPQDVASKVEVSDAQIETYYQTNKANYVSSAESQLAHIQVANEQDANAVLQALKNGEDFAKLAQEKSLDKGSAAQGGDLGWAKAGTYPAAFEAAASGLKVGETSQAVKIDNAYHIIKLLNHKGEKNIPLEQVKQQIADTIRQELIQSEYANTAREMAKTAYDNSGSLADIAKLGGVTVQTTEEFTADNVPTALNDEKVLKVLFNSDLRRNGQVSEGIELGNGSEAKTLFLRVSQYQEERTQSLDEAKTAVSEAVKLEKANIALQTKVENELKALQAGESNSTTFAPSLEIIFAQAQIQQPEIADTVFSMPKPTDKPSYRIARNSHGDMLIIALDKIEDGDKAQFDTVASQFAAAEQVLLFNNVVQDLRDRAKIEINQEFIEQQQNSSH
ncbi:SurA N-terminal domain-containing protein [Bibersteinia trehalosi]|uniref:SurA N-terminal domain-containing protein n=1 Tax=Bibersteinia trehalosi TaxID=47735 RepID=UPI002D766559|nr:SurA N-terminal domain-containing protein [Bibersteinia trehalosi]